MNADCGYYKYCVLRDCEECRRSCERNLELIRTKPERDEKNKLKAESGVIRKANAEKRKLELQPEREKAAERKAKKIENEALAKESKKRCVKCLEILDIEQFSKGVTDIGNPYWQNKCKSCVKNEYIEKHGEFVPYKAEKAKVAALLAKGMQFCKKCGIEKPFDKFTKSVVTKGISTELSTGYNFVCKECNNEANIIRLNTPEKIIERERRAVRRIEVAKEKEEKRLLAEKRDAERAHPDYRAGQRKKVMDRRKSRMKTDPAYRIKITLRSRIRKLIKGKAKVGSHIRDLGCSVAELKIYLESKFKRGMSWENHGKMWHIDHIIALSTFDLTVRAEYLKAVHYTNLQPLTIKANLEKGNGHIDGQQFCLI